MSQLAKRIARSSAVAVKSYLLGAGMYADRSKYPLPDVVLTDLRMGNESGLDLVEWIRNQPSPLRETKVVILTGSASAIQFEAAEKIGAQKVYRKLTRLEDLRELMSGVAAEFGPAPTDRPRA